ncbi:MAG: DUF3828 domain-containing protein [Proteobacteria bacterium]|nr:DUF3828 domain-containing protein [Pseudomonadota bacterium]
MGVPFTEVPMTVTVGGKAQGAALAVLQMEATRKTRVIRNTRGTRLCFGGRRGSFLARARGRTGRGGAFEVRSIDLKGFRTVAMPSFVTHLSRAVVAIVAAFVVSAAPARADAVPQEAVYDFYCAYQAQIKMKKGNWVKALVIQQKANLDPSLAAGLTEIAGNPPGSGKPRLDFDPFSNSQSVVKRFSVMVPTRKGALALVPVGFDFGRGAAQPVVRVTVALKPSGKKWKITNFRYPAESGVPAWDLKGFLKKTLKH